jgi:hypothetical protein
MAAQRFHSLFESIHPATVSTVKVAEGFVACPAALLVGLSMSEQMFIQEVYRIARGRTDAQTRPPFRLPEFSLN